MLGHPSLPDATLTRPRRFCKSPSVFEIYRIFANRPPLSGRCRTQKITSLEQRYCFFYIFCASSDALQMPAVRGPQVRKFKWPLKVCGG